MVDVGTFFLRILKGDFLVKGDALKKWKVIFSILGMSIAMITCAHQADEKVMKIGYLNKKIRILKAEYVDSATKVTCIKMESTIKDKVKSEGLVPSRKPPIKIIVKSKRDE